MYIQNCFQKIASMYLYIFFFDSFILFKQFSTNPNHRLIFLSADFF